MYPLLVVLTNWKRPQHLPEIVAALKTQSVSAPILLVDNSPADANGSTVEQLRPQLLDVWRMTVNHGPPCRFAPGMLYHDYQFLLFLDDDYVPGSRLNENLLLHANRMRGQFSTIGWYGRRFPPKNGTWNYIYKEARPASLAAPMKVDMTVRGHLVRADCLHYALAFKWKLLGQYQEELKVSLGRHDDFLLCQGIQFATQWPSYIAAGLPGTNEGAMIYKPLDDAEAASKSRPGHQEERNQCVQMAAKVGWRSLC